MNNRLKRSIFIGFLLLFFSNTLFATEVGEVWSRLYRRSTSRDLKFTIMLNIIELNDRGLIPLLTEILSDDIIGDLNNKRTVTEEKNFNELAKLVIRELGELKAKSSAAFIYDIVLNAKEPLLVAEAILALGNMRAVEYVDDIAFILRNRNMRPGEDTQAEEKIAYACILALDRFKSIEGYSSTFFASIGWYSKRLKVPAAKAIRNMVDDPIEALIPIIDEGTYDDKNYAMEEVKACKAPPENKAKAARVALEEGLAHVPDNIRDDMKLGKLRVSSILLLINTGSKDVEDVKLFNGVIERNYDLTEVLYAINALGRNGGDEAVAILSKRLKDFNQKMVDGFGLTYTEVDIIEELINSLGKSGNPNAKGVLTEAQFSGYTKALQRKIKSALQELN